MIRVSVKAGFPQGESKLYMHLFKPFTPNIHLQVLHSQFLAEVNLREDLNSNSFAPSSPQETLLRANSTQISYLLLFPLAEFIKFLPMFFTIIPLSSSNSPCTFVKLSALAPVSENRLCEKQQLTLSASPSTQKCYFKKFYRYAIMVHIPLSVLTICNNNSPFPLTKLLKIHCS